MSTITTPRPAVKTTTGILFDSGRPRPATLTFGVGVCDANTIAYCEHLAKSDPYPKPAPQPFRPESLDAAWWSGWCRGNVMDLAEADTTLPTALQAAWTAGYDAGHTEAANEALGDMEANDAMYDALYAERLMDGEVFEC